MKLKFIKVNPIENMTIFIRNPIERFKQMDIAKEIMDSSHLQAEQVGFIEMEAGNQVHLQMMGGEFCVNATRSLAAVLVQESHPSVRKVNDEYFVEFSVSGTDEICLCRVRAIDNEFKYEVSLELHDDLKAEKAQLN
ncbi:MAG: hypothetical protein JW702_05380 [Clostridiales bacterium]|nr:hypothetical protein [Clostridiales bacterium]